MSPARRLLTLFTSKTCSLCTEAKESLYQIQKRIPFDLEEVDIHQPENQKRWEKYTFDIPVLHVDNKFAMQHRIDQEKLLKLLQQAPIKTQA